MINPLAPRKISVRPTTQGMTHKATPATKLMHTETSVTNLENLQSIEFVQTSASLIVLQPILHLPPLSGNLHTYHPDDANFSHLTLENQKFAYWSQTATHMRMVTYLYKVTALQKVSVLYDVLLSFFPSLLSLLTHIITRPRLDILNNESWKGPKEM